MGRFQRSVQLAKDSFSVLKAEKELMAIPVIGFVVTVAVGALVGAGIYVTLSEGVETSRVGGQVVSNTTLQPTPVTFVASALGVYLLTFVSFYFSAALVAGAYQRLTGGNATLGSAFGAATARIPQIAGWSVVAAIINIIVNQIQNRGIAGAVVGGVIDAAWRTATWLVVPVIIVEGPGPIASLKRATSLFKQTWGENLIAQAGFGLLGFVVILGGIVVSVALGALLPVAGFVVAVVWVAVAATVLSALNGIFRTALYLYATGHSTPWFSQETMAASFAPKQGRFR